MVIQVFVSIMTVGTILTATNILTAISILTDVNKPMVGFTFLFIHRNEENTKVTKAQ